jgi:hypothetical protein
MIICRRCGHRSPTGATFCENRECGAFLEWEGDAQPTEAIHPPPAPGPAREASRPAPSSPAPPGPTPPAPANPAQPGHAPPRPSPAGPAQVGLTARLAEHELAVEPGESVESEITLRNTGTVVDRYAIQVLGDAARWTTVDPPSVNLVPGAEGSARVVFNPPRSPDVVAGPRPFRLVATSSEDQTTSAFTDGTVEVGQFHDVTATLHPQTVEGRSGTYHVTIANRGNAPASVNVGATDPQGALAFRISHPVATMPPGRDGTVTVQAQPQSGTLSGAPRPYRFQVVADDGIDPVRPMDAQLVYRPRLPPISRSWLLPLRIVLTLLGALLMVLGAFANWFPGVDGTDLTYDTYAQTVFQAEAPSPPEAIDTTLVSMGIVPIVLAVLAALGLVGATGKLTRFAAGLALLLMIVFAVTVATADVSLAAGVSVVIVGTIIALAGGICGRIGKS